MTEPTPVLATTEGITVRRLAKEFRARLGNRDQPPIRMEEIWQFAFDVTEAIHGNLEYDDGA